MSTDRTPASAQASAVLAACRSSHQLRQSVGLQRGMLVAGLVLDRGLPAHRRSSRRCSRRTGSPRLRDARRTFGAQAAAGAEHLLGHHRRRLRRVLPHHLGRADRARWSSSSPGLLDLRRRRSWAWSPATSAAGSTACWSCSPTRSTPSRRCCWRSSCRSSISGGQSEPLGRHPGRGDLDHRGLHPAVLPGGPRRGRARQGRAVRRVGQGHRRLHARASCSGTCCRNATRTLPLIITLNASEAMLTLAGLGFLGLRHRADRGRRMGLRPQPALVRRHQRHLVDRRSSPGVAIVLTVLGMTLVGEAINDLADPRLRHAPQDARPRPTRAAASEPSMSENSRRPAWPRPTARCSSIAATSRSTFATDAGDVAAVAGRQLRRRRRRGARRSSANPAPARP